MSNGSAFILRYCKSSSAGVFYDVHDGLIDHPVATVAVTAERPNLLEVIHPRCFYRIDGNLMEDVERRLLAWLSDSESVNTAIRQVGGEPIGQVGWIEAVRITQRGTVAVSRG